MHFTRFTHVLRLHVIEAIMLFTNKNNSFRCIRESRDRGAWFFLVIDSFSLHSSSNPPWSQLPVPSFLFPFHVHPSCIPQISFKLKFSFWPYMLFSKVSLNGTCAQTLRVQNFAGMNSCLTAVLWGNSSLDNWNRNSFARDIFPKLIDWTKQVTPKVRTSQYDWCLNIKIRRWTQDFIGYITICICV